MEDAEKYRPDSPRVVHETLDGQTVIVHLDKGIYYSLDRIGSSIWQLLSEGASRGQVLQNLCVEYDAPMTLMEDAVANFIVQLRDEALIVPMPPGTECPVATLLPREGRERQAFVVPVLQRYSDMQDLLLLDPVHDVDESGWPNARRDGA
jgi:hypothetical protein